VQGDIAWKLGTVYIRQLFRLYFGMVISKCVFLQCSIYHRMVLTSSSVAMVRATPYKLFLKVVRVSLMPLM